MPSSAGQVELLAAVETLPMVDRIGRRPAHLIVPAAARAGNARAIGWADVGCDGLSGLGHGLALVMVLGKGAADSLATPTALANSARSRSGVGRHRRAAFPLLTGWASGQTLSLGPARGELGRGITGRGLDRGSAPPTGELGRDNPELDRVGTRGCKGARPGKTRRWALPRRRFFARGPTPATRTARPDALQRPAAGPRPAPPGWAVPTGRARTGAFRGTGPRAPSG